MTDLWLFAKALFEVGMLCGFLPVGLLLICLKPGRVYDVLTLWLGKYDRFIGRCTQTTKYRAEFVVIDPGPRARVQNKCPYPECIRAEHGEGEHEFPRIREGALIGVALKYSTIGERSDAA